MASFLYYAASHQFEFFPILHKARKHTFLYHIHTTNKQRAFKPKPKRDDAMSAPAPAAALAASENKKRKIVVKPRDALVVENILSQMGAHAFEPRVVNQSLEFIYRYVGDVLEEARIFQRHRIGYNNNNDGDNDLDKDVVVGADGETNVNVEELKKRSVSVQDVRLASRVILSREFAANDASAASAESLQKACAKLNEKPMPKLLERPGIRVPQDDNLLSDNYEIGPARGKEGEEQMRLALERDRKRKEAEEKERMEMLAQLQGGIAPTALTRGEGDGAGVQFNVRATKAIEVTTEKVKVDAKTKEAFEPEEEDYD